MKVFVDTNILIDFLSHREKFYNDAKKVFALGLLHRHDLIISALSIANTMYIAHKYGYENIKAGLESMFKFLEVADYKKEFVKGALSLGWKDYEDATQFLSAKYNDCDCIVTRNKKDFEKALIQIFTPQEFLSLPINNQ